MVRREAELAKPGTIERIKDASSDPPLSRIIERYVAEHATGRGATKGYVLAALK
jgi:hypothetical protein